MRQRIRSIAAIALGVLIGAGSVIFVVLWKVRSGAAQPAPARLEEPVITAASPADPQLADARVTADDLRRALQEAAAKLVNLRIAVAERGDFSIRQPSMPVPVIFKQIWIHGQSAQVLYDQRDNVKGESWWEGFAPVKGSLISANLRSLPGLKICVDVTRRDVVWAEFRSTTGDASTLYSRKKSLDWLGDVFLPLIELDKPWVLPQRYNAAPVVNAIARRPTSAWRVLGEQRLGDIECVSAEIDQQDTVPFPLQRHTGELKITPSWLVWFSKLHGLMPVRAEQSVRYEFQETEYRLARRDDGLATLVYEASDFVKIGDVWFPRRGRQNTYLHQQRGEPPANRFDPDALVDKLLADGMLSPKGEMQLLTSREWRILDLALIDPALNLWFDPPPGAEVVSIDTGKRFVQGDIVASAKHAAREQAIEVLIGKPAPKFPADAIWLNGQPITWQSLRGQVVILDFWADWCGPCRNDLPELGQLHAGREKNGLTIIGVHPPGSELESIKKVMDEYKIAYPICIDVPYRGGATTVEGASFWGDLFAQYAIDAIPHFVVIDARGVVVASESNRFEEALAAAKQLVVTKTDH